MCACVYVYASVCVLMEARRKSQSPGAVIFVANGCEPPHVSETIKCGFFFSKRMEQSTTESTSFQFSTDYINEYGKNYINSSE